MYENQTYDTILERMLDRIPSGSDKRPSSVIYDTHSATAIEFQTLYIELEYLVKNSYGDTAAREFLILLAKDRGLSPKPATNAVLSGEFVPSDVDVTGKRFNISEINYTVTEKISPGHYQVRCETKGTVGNKYFGEMLPVDYVNGLQSAMLTGILIPGEDEEDTEMFRQRYLNSFNAQEFGGNRADYFAKIKSIDGVGDCKIERVWNKNIAPMQMIPGAAVIKWYNSISDSLSPEVATWLSKVYTAASEKKLTVGGTVLVTVVNAMDFGAASEVLIDKIQTILDPEENAGEGYGLAPIGHVVSVRSAEPMSVFITTSITFSEGYNWQNVKDNVITVLNDYLLELRRAWADQSSIIVRISQVEARILNVNGVIDIESTKINGSVENLNLTQYQIPVLGGVSA